MIPTPSAHAAERYAHAIVRAHDQPRGGKKSRASQGRKPGRTSDQKITAIEIFFVWHKSPLCKVLQRLVNKLRCPSERVSAVGGELHREISAIGALPCQFEHFLQVYVVGFAIELHRVLYVAHIEDVL